MGIRLVSLLVAASGCTGFIESSQLAGLSPEEAVAQTAWLSKALPVMRDNCQMCHDGTVPQSPLPAPLYMMASDDLAMRDVIIHFTPPVINLDAPESSRILVKGGHEGPKLDAVGASNILQWLQAEQKAQPAGTVVETMMAPPMMCTGGAPGTATCPINHIDLGALGSTGSTLDYVAMIISPDLYLTNLTVTPGAGGVHIEHPQFETYPGGAPPATLDPEDTFFNVVINVPAGMPATNIGPGNLILSGFSSVDPLAVRFKSVGNSQ